MKTVDDHLGRTITLPSQPKRIISLAPAITDTLFHLDLAAEVVGRTRFCIHPKGIVEHAVNVGGTKDIKIERIQQLHPDLIIAEKEENTKEIVEKLEKYFPIFVFEVQTIEDAYRMINDLGHLTDRQKQASHLVAEIKNQFQKIPHLRNKKAAYMIWQNPFMVVGKQTYIQSLLEKMGLINPFVFNKGRYPIVTIEELRRTSLDYLFLATEPYPFQEKHVEKFSKILPETKPVIMDGEMFWYGVKMLEAVPYLKKKLEEISSKG